MQGRGDGPKASTSWASEAARVKAELDCATLWVCFAICLSLRPVGSIHISCLAAREQTSAAQIAKASPPYNMKYFLFIFGIIFQFYFLTEADVYECSYRRTAHHATELMFKYPTTPWACRYTTCEILVWM